MVHNDELATLEFDRRELARLNLRLIQLPEEIKANMLEEFRKIAPMWKEIAQRHVDKAPPEHPQVQSGRLQRSFHYRVRPLATGCVLRVWNTAPYATYLEFGFWSHRAGRFIGPYPFMMPSMMETLDRKYGHWKVL